MQYKTIVQELINNHPEQLEALRSSNRLLLTIAETAHLLRQLHLDVLATMKERQPEVSVAMLKAEALQVAIAKLKVDLPHEFERINQSHHVVENQ